MNKNKVIVMLSGGLDSTLAAKLMIEQGLDVIAYNMTSMFCTCTPKKGGCNSLAVQMAKQLGIEIVVQAKGDDYLEIVRKPRFGYGSGLNPCMDCRTYTFEKAKELMKERGAVCIVTGEVLGQRPMSQRMKAMELIERAAGLEGKVLRPLSAHLFPETEVEKAGIIDRSKLLAIKGRGRKEQIELAKDKDLMGFSCGTGGCLLTDQNMKKKMLDLYAHHEKVTMPDVRRLRYGRHFRFPGKIKVILGRNEAENQQLAMERRDTEFTAMPIDIPGPTVLVEALPSQKMVELAANMMAAFAKSSDGQPILIELSDSNGKRQITIPVKAIDYEQYWISKE